MKKIAVFFSLPEMWDYPMSNDGYRGAYFQLSQEIKKVGGELYIVRSQSTYQGHGTFSRSWQYQGPDAFTETGELQADVIFDKGYFISDHTVPVFNNPQVNEICTDKWKMYQLFGQYCPKTFHIASAQELAVALPQITTELAVVKPIDGEEGHGVFIKPVVEIQAATTQFPVLLQEFLDSSAGIPGIVEGMHDFRIAIINGEIIFAFVRTPPTGSFLANVAQGGKLVMVEPAKIPSSMTKIMLEIEKEMSKLGPRFYAIDFALTPTGPKIIEMNSRVGLLNNSVDPIFQRVKQRLAEVFMEL